MGPDCYILQQQEQLHLPEELKQEGPDWYLDWTGLDWSWTLMGPDCYLLLQQEQHPLPEELDTGGT